MFKSRKPEYQELGFPGFWGGQMENEIYIVKCMTIPGGRHLAPGGEVSVDNIVVQADSPDDAMAQVIRKLDQRPANERDWELYQRFVEPDEPMMTSRSTSIL